MGLTEKKNATPGVVLLFKDQERAYVPSRKADQDEPFLLNPCHLRPKCYGNSSALNTFEISRPVRPWCPRLSLKKPLVDNDTLNPIFELGVWVIIYLQHVNGIHGDRPHAFWVTPGLPAEKYFFPEPVPLGWEEKSGSQYFLITLTCRTRASALQIFLFILVTQYVNLFLDEVKTLAHVQQLVSDEPECELRSVCCFHSPHFFYSSPLMLSSYFALVCLCRNVLFLCRIKYSKNQIIAQWLDVGIEIH